jgi:ATP-dependent DNA ligase
VRRGIIDGEAVCCGDDGVPSFDLIRYRRRWLREGGCAAMPD